VTEPPTDATSGQGSELIVVTPALVAHHRESEFPGIHQPEIVPVSRPTNLADSQNPYRVYLSSLGSDEAKRAMAGCLDRIAELWAGLTGAQLEKPYGHYFAWERLRFQHAAAIRALLLEQTTKTGKPWAPAYRNKHLSALRQVMRNAWLLGHMTAEEYYQAREIRNVKGVRLPPGRHIGPTERQALVDVCGDGTLTGARDAALIATLYSTGCRREELATAERAHYDPGSRTLVVIGKGDKQREVYLTETAAAQLGQWLILAPKDGALFSPIDKWGNVHPGHMSADAVGKIVARRAKQGAIPDVSAHDFRRTFAGDLLDRGVDLATVQQLLGHVSASTTAGYDRRPASIRRAAVDRLDQPP
jgi:integrase/recombinase XerC